LGVDMGVQRTGKTGGLDLAEIFYFAAFCRLQFLNDSLGRVDGQKSGSCPGSSGLIYGRLGLCRRFEKFPDVCARDEITAGEEGGVDACGGDQAMGLMGEMRFAR